MHQFGWLSEKGGNFLNLLEKEWVPLKRGGVSTLEEIVDVSPKKIIEGSIFFQNKSEIMIY